MLTSSFELTVRPPGLPREVEEQADITLPMQLPEGTAERISCHVHLSHDDLGEVELSLVSPSGTVIPLGLGGASNEQWGTWTTQREGDGMAALLEEPVGGTWGVRYLDQTPGGSGLLHDVRISVVVDSPSSVRVDGSLVAEGPASGRRLVVDHLRVSYLDVDDQLPRDFRTAWCREECGQRAFAECRDLDCHPNQEVCRDDGPADDGVACLGGRCLDGACCVPATCLGLGPGACGQRDDGCGGTAQCGGCGEGEGCNQHGRCAPVCSGVACPDHPGGWPAACNFRGHCEYTPADDPTAAEIWVPAGTFSMGAPADEWNFGESEGPVHDITFALGFLVGKYEVTVQRYQACRDAEVCDEPLAGEDQLEWGVNSVDNGRAAHPQSNLTQGQAAAYCAWIGGRLPSEAEGEYAASGPRHHLWPWGDGPDADCLHAVSYQVGDACDDPGSRPVGSVPTGASFVGALDMAGNIYEWVADCWHASYEDAPADGSAWDEDCLDGGVVLRGGGWFNGRGGQRTAKRLTFPAARRSVYFGARCVRDLP